VIQWISAPRKLNSSRMASAMDRASGVMDGSIGAACCWDRDGRADGREDVLTRERELAVDMLGRE
jgi:hypothetical protein